MARVLVFGDSITWGYSPSRSGRFDADHRWPEVMEDALDGVQVITEALNGRLTAYDDPSSPAELNGARILPTILTSQMPLDLTVFMLGTNDIFHGLGLLHVVRGLTRLVEIVRHHPTRTSYVSEQILLVAPPMMIADISPDVDEARATETRGFSERIRQVAEECGTAFFDASAVVQPSRVDGVHLDAEMSRKLGLALADPVAGLLAKD